MTTEGKPTGYFNQTYAVEFSVAGSLDGTTLSPPILDSPPTGQNPGDPQQLFRREVTNLGLIDVDYLVPADADDRRGARGNRYVAWFWIEGPNMGGADAIVDIVDAVDGTPIAQKTIGSFVGRTDFFQDSGILVPQGSMIRVRGVSGNGASDPVKVRLHIDFLNNAADMAAVQEAICCAETLAAAGGGGSGTLATGFFDVTEYGAVGDGVTDDTSAIDDALAAAALAGGGIVWFPAGIFRITSPLNPTTGVKLAGVDPSSAVLIGAGVNGVVTSVESLEIESLGFRDFNTAIALTVAAGTTLDHVRISNCEFSGHLTAIGWSAPLATAVVSDLQITNNEIVNCSVANIVVEGRVETAFVSGNFVHDSVGMGIQIGNATGALQVDRTNIKVVSNSVRDLTVAGALDLYGIAVYGTGATVETNTISGLTCVTGEVAGIYTRVVHGSITGNVVRTLADTGGTNRGIHVAGSARSGAAPFGYGVSVSANVISSVTDGIRLTGDGHVIANNYIDEPAGTGIDQASSGDGELVISGNIIRQAGAVTDPGILITDGFEFVIVGNQIRGFVYGIRLLTSTSINRAIVSNNSVTGSTTGMEIQAAGGGVINDVTMVGNRFSNTTANGVHVLGAGTINTIREDDNEFVSTPNEFLLTTTPTNFKQGLFADNGDVTLPDGDMSPTTSGGVTLGGTQPFGNYEGVGYLRTTDQVLAGGVAAGDGVAVANNVVAGGTAAANAGMTVRTSAAGEGVYAFTDDGTLVAGMQYLNTGDILKLLAAGAALVALTTATPALSPEADLGTQIGAVGARWSEGHINTLYVAGAESGDGVAGATDAVLNDGSGDGGFTIYTGNLAGDIGMVAITGTLATADGWWSYEPNTNTHVWGVGGAAELELDAGALYASTGGGLDLGGSGNEFADLHLSSQAFIGSPTLNTGGPITAVGTNGQVIVSDNETNLTQKLASFGVNHYTNTEEPTAIFVVDSDAAAATVNVGGGVAAFNAATAVRFFTAANTITTTGSERGSFDSAGLFTLLAGLTLDSASPTALFGDASGTPQVRLAKGAAAEASVEYALATGADTAGDFRTVLDSGEAFRIQRYNASWEETFTVDTGKHVTIYNNLTLSNASPIFTVGDATGSPDIRALKVAAGTSSFRFGLAAALGANDKQFLHDTDETLKLQHYNGASWDTALTIDNSANVVIANDLSVDKLIIGGATLNTAGPITALGTNGQVIVSDNETNLTQKFSQYGVTHYTNVEEPTAAFVVDSDAAAATVNIGGGVAAFNAATAVRFFTAANTVTTTGTERGSFDSAGLFTLNADLTLDSASPTTTFGDGTGSPILLARKIAAGGVDFQFRVGAGASVANDKRIQFDASENLNLANYNGASWDTALTIDNSANVVIANDLAVDKLIVGGATLNTGGPITALGTNGQVIVSDNETNLTQKFSQYGVTHYTNVEEPTAAFVVDSDAAAATVNIGGGVAAFNAATAVRFFTAANTTTTTGSERGSFDSAGLFTLNADLILDSASPLATFGDGTGAPRVIVDKVAASAGLINYATGALLDWQVGDDSSENFVVARYIAGVFQDSPFLVDNAAGNVTLANDLQVDGTASITGTNRFDADGFSQVGTPLTDLTNKQFRIGVLPYTLADGTWRALTVASALTANTIRLGGGSTIEGATAIEFWTSTAVNTAATLRGNVGSTGQFNWAGNMLLNSASPTATVGDGTGSPQFVIDKSDAGTGTIRFRKATVNQWRIELDAAEALAFGRYDSGGTFQDSPLSIEQLGGNITLANSAIVGADLTLNSSSPTLTIGRSNALHATAFDVFGTSIAAVFSDIDTDATDKNIRIGGGHYTNTEEPLALIYANSAVGSSVVNIGGGTSLMNAATDLRFFTGATTTTVAGTQRGSISSAGAWAIGASGVSAIHSVYGTGIVLADVSTDLANKAFNLQVRPYTNADGFWIAVNVASSLTTNVLRIGGTSTSDSATNVDFYTATAVNTSGTLRGDINSTGLFNWLGNVTLNSASPTLQVADGVSGSSANILLLKGAGAGDEGIVKFFVTDSTPSANDKRLVHNINETFSMEHYNGASWDTALTIDNSANVQIANDLSVDKLIVGGATLNTTGPITALGTNGQVIVSDNETNLTTKNLRLGVTHYTNIEEPTAFAHLGSAAGSATLTLGGGTSVFNAVTALRFFTAANTITQTGTERGQIDSTGAWSIGLDGTAVAHRIWGTGLAVADNNTNLTNKLFNILGRPYTNADGTWVTVDIAGTSGSNTLRLGGAGGRGATSLQFWTSPDTTSASVLAGNFDSAGDFTLANNLTLDSASPTATVGDGTGSPNLFMNKVAAGSNTIEWRTGGLRDWLIQDTSGENFGISRYIAGAFQETTLTILNATGELRLAKDLLLNSASPDATFGDGTGGPQLFLDKAVASSSEIQLTSAGNRNWILQNEATTEDFRVIRYIADAVQDVPLTIFNASGLVALSGNFTLDSASPTALFGDASGSPQHRLAKAVGGESSVEYVQATGSDTTGDFRTVLDASEVFRIQRYAIGAWEEALAIGTSKHVSIYNNLTLASASPTATFGAGTGGPILQFDKAVASNNEIKLLSVGNRNWILQNEATTEDFRIIRYIADAFTDVPLLIANATGNITTSQALTVGANLTLDSASPVATYGDGTGSPILLARKVAAGGVDFQFRVGAGASVANDKRIQFDSSENLNLANYNGATWDDALTIDNSADVLIPNQLLLAGAAAANGITGFESIVAGDGTDDAGVTFYVDAAGDGGMHVTNTSGTADGSVTYDVASNTWFFATTAGNNRARVNAAGVMPGNNVVDALGADTLRWEKIFVEGPVWGIEPTAASITVADKRVIIADASLANVNINLPAALSGLDYVIVVLDITYAVNIVRGSGDTINGAAVNPNIGAGGAGGSGVGRYFITALDATDWRLQGPVAEV